MMLKPWERDFGRTREHPKVIDLTVYLGVKRFLRHHLEVPPPNFPTKGAPDIEGPLLQRDEQEATGDADPEPEA